MDPQPTSSKPLQWVSHDAWLIMMARFFRTFAQSSIAVFFAIYLDDLGYSLTEIGLLITVGSAGSTVFALLVVFVGGTIGRRHLLIAFSVGMGVVGIGFAFTDRYLLLAVFSFFVGSIVVSGGGPRGPIQPLETATLPDTTTPEHRTDLFALSGIMERLARFSGSLSAALPPVFVTVFGVSHLGGFKIMFIGYTVLMLASAVMYSFLSPAVEHVAVKGGWQNPLKLPSRRTIFTLAAIFSLDSFATRFVFFSLVALWFRTQYGLDLAELSYLLASTTILGGISLWASAKLANRIGLLNTIVFTHIPAVLFTIAVPFAPTAWLAVTLWLARGFFSSMDNPPRQSYIMAIVNREERAAMASVSNVSQAATGAATPLLATVLMQGLAAGAPFVVSGVIKSVYLVGLYLMFKDVHPPEEVARIEARRRRAESRSSGSEAPK